MAIEKIRDRAMLLVDLFMGAACADKRCDDSERSFVRDLVAKLMCVDELPEVVETRISCFSPTSFVLYDAAEQFAHDPPMKKRRLLELVAQVFEVDAVFDVAECDYLSSLASFLGMRPDEYRDLTFEYEIEELVDSFQLVSSTSHPIPEASELEC